MGIFRESLHRDGALEVCHVGLAESYVVGWRDSCVVMTVKA